MWNIICECVNQLAQTPSVQQVMQQIQQHTICTTTQCFDDDTHAFGIQPSVDTASYTPYLIMAAAIAMMIVNMPVQHMTEKDS